MPPGLAVEGPQPKGGGTTWPQSTPLIITAGLTGSRISKQQTPAHPDHARRDRALRASRRGSAGASVVHVHVRDVATGLGTQDVAVFREVVELPARRDRRHPLPHDQRHPRAQPEHRESDWRRSPCGRRWRRSTPARSTPKPASSSTTAAFLDAAAAAAREHGVKLELECFDTGMIVTALRYHEQGLLPAPLHFQFLLGSRFGMPATARAAGATPPRWSPADATWSVIGIGTRAAADGDDGPGDGRARARGARGQHLLPARRAGDGQRPARRARRQARRASWAAPSPRRPRRGDCSGSPRRSRPASRGQRCRAAHLG